jgi:hypothetical protein
MVQSLEVYNEFLGFKNIVNFLANLVTLQKTPCTVECATSLVLSFVSQLSACLSMCLPD